MINLENANIDMYNGRIAYCSIDCFERTLYIIFKDTSSGDIDDIEKIMENSYQEWVSGDNMDIVDIPCEEYILRTLNAYKHNIVAVIYEGDDE